MPDPICMTCEHLRVPPDKYTAPARCAKDGRLDIERLSIQHSRCPQRPVTPRFGLTVLAPWSTLIAWGGKNIENRSSAVATSIGDYRGRVALTASAAYPSAKGRRSIMHGRAGSRRMRDDVANDIVRVVDSFNELGITKWSQPVDVLAETARLAGRWFATARIADVLSPAENTGPWALKGQAGIVLADITLLEHAELATGSLGFFPFGRCVGCGRAVSMYANHPCKRSRS